MKLKLTDNLFLKVLSVIIAMVLWLVVVNISDAVDTEKYTLEVGLENTDVITSNGKVFRVIEGTNIVRLTVRARKSILNELKATDFIVTADMQKDLKYDSLVGISILCKNPKINVDENVTLSRSNVEVSIEDSATEQFQVLVKKTGTENTGLVVGSMVPEQTIIKITGPVSIVDRIKTVEAMVDVTGLPATAVKTCELKLYDSAGGEIDNTYLKYVGKSNGIDVTVSMLNTKTVPLRFSYAGTPAENYEVSEISYKPETVEIAGNAGVLSGILRIDVPAEAVDVEGIDEELQLVIDLTQYLPSGVILKDQNEASVLVIVEVEYVEPEEDEEEDKEQEESKPSEDQPSEEKPEVKPETDQPSTDKPSTDKPSTDKPSVDEPEEVPKEDAATGMDPKEDSGNETGIVNNDKTELE